MKHRKARADNEPCDKENHAGDDTEADDGGEEGADEGSTRVVAIRVWIVVLVLWIWRGRRVGVGGALRRCLSSVRLVVGRRGWVAGGRSRRILHSSKLLEREGRLKSTGGVSKRE